MKKAGIPERTAREYYYTKGKRDNTSPANCLNHSFLIAVNMNPVLPLPEKGSVSLNASEKTSRRMIFKDFGTGKYFALSYCAHTDKKPATGIYSSNIRQLDQIMTFTDGSQNDSWEPGANIKKGVHLQ